ncbi:nitrous oxide reductase family maturation protein NosD, partial [Thermoplasmatota archaeon]
NDYDEKNIHFNFSNINIVTIGILFLFFGANVQISESEKNTSEIGIMVENILCGDCDCTIYVDDDNTGGPWDGTESNPYNKIQEAIDNAIVGDCICVNSGIYYENIKIEGSLKNGITLCGENRDSTIIDGGNKLGTDTVYLGFVDDITIMGFNITGSGHDYDDIKYTYHGINCYDASNVLIKENIIYDNGNGINGNANSLIFIEDNMIIQNLCDGIRGHSELYIDNNLIMSNGYGDGPSSANGDGISIWSNAKKSTFTNNIISNNRIDGIWDEGVDDHLIIGNTISNNGQSGIHLFEGKSCIISNNIIDHNGYGGDVRAFYTAGILLISSISNSIDNNTIINNNKGIDISKSNSNTLKNNIVRGNGVGLYMSETSSHRIHYNLISENNLGIFMMIASGFELTYNDIYTNNVLGLVSIIGIGTATNNWWGNIFGPYMGNTVRFIPPIPILFPWTLTGPNTQFEINNNINLKSNREKSISLLKENL